MGSNANKAKEIIRSRAKREKAPLRIESLESKAKKDPSPHLFAALAEPGRMVGPHSSVAVASNQAQSRVSAGENSGKQLTHVAVVRSLQSLGDVQMGARR